ncbi:NAD-dependent succinate-semialdehyde dehydrogenase [Alteromonas macleodii]|uniref:NAD-dependent succinate-semialdehyde dehydrogenase n=1 Tax=Alteromonas macleodii TaxID=28108 RepID=UPI001289250E|nr:NAD-dependent succinate-semialdehyde dehydrogenase [Alteromonas macleodii]CAI2388194.1 succinate semialdehyde dehydrogenase [Alteromonas macleodii]CAI3924518.1 succinate semialdehyde dehydrogenase [Alteromonas macleodii]CAI3924684.1 succinate semialdehyde dehydrogenase [Alteromonas macleodii]CAI3924723.1 succinate semialdehyde dehydrogenase [Alteromonas macleodii]VTO37790.1 succinate semialdehyde dehydrogenase [Alteromonas macleodii]
MTLQSTSIFRDKCLLNGEWCGGESPMPVYNPATGDVIAHVPSLGADETNQAIDDAALAFSSWKQTSPMERARLLRKWYQLILDEKSSLAYIMSCEQGKPLTEASAEIAYAASYVLWFAEEAMRVQGEVLSSANPQQRLIVTRSPVGVCAAITPWNFPAAMITRKVAPALASGCTMLVKPAQQTPLTALALGELANQAGFPAGVLQIITGDAKAIGGAMTSNPVIRKLSFTGSTAIGSLLMSQCAADVKKLSLELGGNAPFIVFDKSDVSLAVEELMKAKFRNAGQTCISPNRVYVQKKVKDTFTKALIAAVAELKLGDGLDPDTTVGPLIDYAAVQKVQKHIENARSLGASVLCGGKRPHTDGNWFEPTVLDNVPANAQCVEEETFGPVVPLITFDTEQDVITLANNTPFGLAAYLFSDDIHQVERVVNEIESGMVGINTGVISAANAPFGGVKASGLGREGAHTGIEEYLEMKYQCYGLKA